MAKIELEAFDREALHQARKRALLWEAGKQFAEKGFHGTSMASIAKGVKLTKSGLFHYVNTKEELLYQCYEDVLHSADECLKQAEQIEGSALDKLTHYLRAHVTKVGKPGGFFVLITELYVLDPEHQKILRTKAKSADTRLLKLIQDGIDEGSIGYDNPRMAVYAIDGALNWLPKWYSEEGTDSIEDIAEAFIGFFINGLKKR